MLWRPFKEQFSNEALVSAHTAIQIKDYTVLVFLIIMQLVLRPNWRNETRFNILRATFA